MWQPQWESLGSRFRLIRCDLPGFGQSAVESNTVSLGGAVAELLDALELRDCIVVGNSLGGRLALELALARPELVRALVLVGALLPGGERSAALQAFNRAEEEALAANDVDRAVELNVEMWLGESAPDTVRDELRRMTRRAFDLQLPWGDDWREDRLAADVAERLAEIAVPVLVVVGDEDVEDVQRFARHLAATLPQAETAVIAGAGHVPSLERPQAFDAAVLPFLERVSG